MNDQPSTTPHCPCHSGDDYARCCQPHHGGLPAPTPEALMRSRFAGFSLGLADYVMGTTHPTGSAFEPDSVRWRASILEFTGATDFVGLEILTTAHDDESHEASVTFRAGLVQGGRDVSFTEKSRFIWELGRWSYHSGVISV